MNICCVLPPYGFSNYLHQLPTAPNMVMTDLLDTTHPAQLCYPTGTGSPLFDSRFSHAEWSQLEEEVIRELDSAKATGSPIRWRFIFDMDGSYAVFCLPCCLLGNLFCLALRDDCLETAKTARQLNVMYDVLARYNATHFNPRLMYARLYVKEDMKAFEWWNPGSERSPGQMNSCDLEGHTLVVAIYIANTQEEFLALPRPVVGEDAAYPDAVGNCCCFHCPRGGLCCCYPYLDYQLDETPLDESLEFQFPSAPVAPAEALYSLATMTPAYSVPQSAQTPRLGHIYAAPAVEMVDHRSPPIAQKIECL